ncbi:MAG: cytochrome c [Gammaproteobacteria bacterium]|nr:cytochrome c [Gammaproteobacteria bacterium]NND39501.1 c-type cytochrome [Pseudomonadales bacterium]NNL10795.1 c-type cytochrome [Pseudomonadales bacterium]
MNTGKCLQIVRLAILPLLVGFLAACAGDSPALDSGEQAAAATPPPVEGAAGDAGVDDVAGLYAAQCASCHGESGQGNVAMQAPQLAGQQAEYLARQLRNFAGGLRGQSAADAAGASMAAMAQGVDAKYFEPLAAYLAQMPVKPVQRAAVAEQMMARGKRVYQSRCGSCHRVDASGIAAMQAPALAGMSSEYLQRQLRNYRSGIRGAAKGDRYGAQMRAMVGTLRDDADLEAVAAYLSTL